MIRQAVQMQLHWLLKTTADALVVVDAKGEIVLINGVAESLFGYSAGELEGRSVEELIPARLREGHVEARGAFMERPAPRFMGERPELSCRRKDGEEFLAEISLSPIETEFGPMVVASIRDLTERRRIELALRESEERFELAAQGSNAGIWDWDIRTNRVYYSPHWKRILGYEDGEITDDYREWESRLHPDDHERAMQTIRAYLDGRTTDYELDHRLRHKDGSYRWIKARGAAVRDSQGRPYRMVGSHVDVTAHRQAEEALRENELQFLAAQRIQQHLLPTKVPRIPGLDIAGASFPARYAGGDLYDFVPMLAGQTGFLVGDVSGHGFASALVMASTHAFLHCLGQTCSTVGEIVTRANGFVCMETEPELFVTLLLARYEPQARRLTYINAGHPPGYVLDAAGEVRAELNSSDMPLGIVENQEYTAGGSIALTAGDVLFMLTDGILEEENEAGEQFGVERSLDVVRRCRDRSARDILESLRRAIQEFTERDVPRDDLTALVVKVHDV